MTTVAYGKNYTRAWKKAAATILHCVGRKAFGGSAEDTQAEELFKRAKDNALHTVTIIIIIIITYFFNCGDGKHRDGNNEEEDTDEIDANNRDTNDDSDD